MAPDLSSEAISRAEHIGPNTTGDNIQAKRVASYYWDGTNWQRAPVATIYDGTNSANILKSDGTAAGQNALMIAGSGYTTSTITLTSGSPTTAWFDLLNYPAFNVGILTNASGATLTWQTAADAAQTNVRGMFLQDSNAGAPNAPVSTTTSAVANFTGQRTGRYFRVSSNVAGGNTVTLVITFFTQAVPPQGQFVTSSALGAKTTNSASPFLLSSLTANFNDTTPTAITEGNWGMVRMSSNRNLYGTIRDAAGNERGANVDANNRLNVADLSAPAATNLNTYSVRLTTNTTTTPTASTAYISSIAIATEVAGTTSTVTIQDKSATPLKLVNGLTTVAATTSPTVINFQTPIKMTSGIDIVTAGGGRGHYQGLD